MDPITNHSHDAILGMVRPFMSQRFDACLGQCDILPHFFTHKRTWLSDIIIPPGTTSASLAGWIAMSSLAMCQYDGQPIELERVCRASPTASVSD